MSAVGRCSPPPQNFFFFQTGPFVAVISCGRKLIASLGRRAEDLSSSLARKYSQQDPDAAQSETVRARTQQPRPMISIQHRAKNIGAHVHRRGLSTCSF